MATDLSLNLSRERESNSSESHNKQSRAENDRQLHQGIMISNQGKEVGKTTDVCSTLLARDYKGFGNQAMTGVIEYYNE